MEERIRNIKEKLALQPIETLRAALRKAPTVLSDEIECFKPDDITDIIHELEQEQHLRESLLDDLHDRREIPKDQFTELLKYVVKNDKTQPLFSAVIKACKGKERGVLASFLDSIIGLANNEIPHLVRIYEILCDGIAAQKRKFGELRNVTDIIKRLEAVHLIRDNQAKNLESIRTTEKCKDKLYKVLADLEEIDDIFKYISILEDTGNDALSKAILPDDKAREIDTHKENALCDMTNELKETYKKRYIKVESPGPSARETVLDFQQPETLMDLRYKAYEPCKTTESESTLVPVQESAPHSSSSMQVAASTNQQDGHTKRHRWKSGEIEKDVDSLSDLMKNKKINRVLYQGDPGCGKTTLLLKYLFEWVFGEDPSVILFIPLRQVRKNELIDIVFDDLNLLEPKYKKVFEMLVNEFSHRLSFFVDGVDDNRNLSNENAIFKILSDGNIHKKVFGTCKMYIALATVFRPTVQLVVVLNGLSKASQSQFVRKHLGCDESKSIQFLSDCRELFDESILSTPIYLLLLCFVAKKDDDIARIFHHTRQNKRGILDAFTDVFKRKYCDTRCHKTAIGTTNKETEEKANELFQKLGRFSFDALLKCKSILKRQDFEEFNIDINEVLDLGCFVIETNTDNSQDDSYRFMHQTFEEYFAGVYYCAWIGFERTILPLLSFKHLLNAYPNALAEALTKAKAGAPTPTLSALKIGQELKQKKPTEDERKALEKYQENREKCIAYEKTQTTSLRDTLSPLDGCILFACGANSTFTKQLFLFAVQACRINTWKDETKSVKCFYDLRYECGLLFEAKDVFRTKDPDLIKCFVNYLTQSNTYEHWRHGQSVQPSSYDLVAARYVFCELSAKQKTHIFSKIYGIQCATFGIDGKGPIFHTDFKSNENTDVYDVLLLQLEKKPLPDVVHCVGSDSNLKVLNQKLESGETLKGIGVLKCCDEQCLDLLNKALRLILTLDSIRVIHLKHCELRERDCLSIINSLTERKLRDQRMPDIEIVACDAQLLAKTIFDQRQLQSLYPEGELALHIEQNLLDITRKDKRGNTPIFTVRKARGSFLYPVVSAFCNIVEISIMDSMLEDTTSEQNWTNLCSYIEGNKELKVLVLEHCNIKESHHLKALGSALKEGNITHLSLSRNKMDIVDTAATKQFIAYLQHAQHLESLKLSGCNLSHASLQYLSSSISNFKNLQEIDLSDNCVDGDIDSLIEQCMAKKTIKQINVRNTVDLGTEDQTSAKQLHGAHHNATIQTLNIASSITGSSSLCSTVREVISSNTLVKLDLSNCSLPIQFQDTPLSVNLKSLILAGTNLGALSESEFETWTTHLSRIKCLQEFDLSKCGLVFNSHYEHLQTCVGKVRIFDISHNILAAVEQQTFQKFMIAFKKANVVEEMHMSYCDLQVHQLLSLGSILRDVNTFTMLVMAGNHLGESTESEWKSFCRDLSLCENLKYLKLSKSKLNKVYHINILLESLGKLSRLNHLNLTMGAFSRVYTLQPTAIQQLKSCMHLRKLCLPQSGLTNNALIIMLCYVIKETKNLRHLDISQNSMKSVTEKEWLKLCNNIGECSELDKINMFECDLTSHHFYGLGTTLKRTPSLQRLNLSGNDVGSVILESWLRFCDGLRTCVSLKKLKMSACNLSGNLHIDEFATTLKELPRLAFLDISGASQFTEPLSSQQENQPLDMCQAMEQSWKNLLSSLQKCKLLQTLNISRNNIKEVIPDLGETVQKLPFLKDVDVSENDIGEITDEGWKTYLQHSGVAKYVRNVNLAHCSLRPEQLKLVAQNISECVFLTALNISGNKLSNVTDVQAFFAGIGKCCQLEIFQLADCGLSKQHLTLLGQSIESMRNLKCLDISQNDLGSDNDKELKAFADCLKNKHNLKELFLAACNAGDSGSASDCFLRHISQVVKYGSIKLSKLDIGGNSISKCHEDVWHEFIDQIAKCSFLTWLDISDENLPQMYTNYFLQNARNFISLESLKLYPSKFYEDDEFLKRLKMFPCLRKVNKRHVRQDSFV